MREKITPNALREGGRAVGRWDFENLGRAILNIGMSMPGAAPDGVIPARSDICVRICIAVLRRKAQNSREGLGAGAAGRKEEREDDGLYIDGAGGRLLGHNISRIYHNL